MTKLAFERDTPKRRVQRQRTRDLIARWRKMIAIDPNWPYIASIQQMRVSCFRLYRARGMKP